MDRTLGLLGDLCCDAEWTWRRMRAVRRSLNQCQDSGLKKRLVTEAAQHSERCSALRASLMSSQVFRHLNSPQVQLLDELLKRTLAEQLVLEQRS